MVKTSVIIVAGGIGSRMGNKTPKQFLLLNTRPILVHTIERFVEALPEAEIIVTLPKDQVEHWRELSQRYGIEGSHRICIGGQTRFHSVQNALEAVGKCDYIAVHDGVRPLVTCTMIRATLQTAIDNQTAIPTVTPVDSLRMMSDDKASFAIDRGLIRLIQTPQIFNAQILKSAYTADYSDQFTDDASVVELAGTPVTLCLGERNNIKITTAEDIVVAEAIMKINLID